MKTTIRIEGAVPLAGQFRFAEPVDWTLSPGEQWAVIGPNGAGKSTLAALLQGRLALLKGSVAASTPRGAASLHEVVRSMEFRDIYSLEDGFEAYSQQRWNATEAERSPLASTLLADIPPRTAARWRKLFSLKNLHRKPIVALSSGELRKVLIIRALASSPRVLVLDNPFVGLDASSRTDLDAVLGRLTSHGVQVVLLLSDPRDVPRWITDVLPVKGMGLLAPRTLTEFEKDRGLIGELFPDGPVTLPAAQPSQPEGWRTVLQMEQVCVRYGNTQIIKDIDWTVRKGEKWALLGPNGSGKSTLLSLVTGDNPQAYANRITLFDRRRGTGESIWDIKRRIGHLNPDMHTFYMKDIAAAWVVASGFFDTVGLYRQPSGEQMAAAAAWLAALGGGHLAGRSFVRLSFGEQRLVLLARAMVKDPAVLILDEPLHGLDAGSRRRATRAIELFCRRADKTLIYVTHYREEIPGCVELFKELHPTNR